MYAFGATLYHLLTNQPPLEAKQRFLRPHALKSPGEINSEIEPEVEQAVLWAMALHPDDRPDDVAAFRQALTSGKPASPTSAAVSGIALESSLDRWLAGAVVTLLLVAILASLT